MSLLFSGHFIKYKKKVCGLDPITKQIKVDERYFLEIHSLQMEYASTEEKNRVQKKTNDSHYFSNAVDRVVANNKRQNEVQMHDKETQTFQDINLSDNKKCKRRKSNTKTPRSSLNMVDGVMTNNEIMNSRIPVGPLAEIDVDKIPLLNAGIVGRRTSEKKKYHLKSQMPDEKIRSYLRHRKRKNIYPRVIVKYKIKYQQT